MRRLFLLTVIVFSCSQKTENCVADKLFEEKFADCISYAQNTYDRNYQHDAGLLSKSFQVLEVLTGHKSSVKFDDGLYWYENETDYLSDLEVWTSWMETKGCKMNVKIAEDSFALHRKPLPDYSDLKIQELVKSRVAEVDRDSAIYYDSIIELSLQLNWPDKFSTK